MAASIKCNEGSTLSHMLKETECPKASTHCCKFKLCMDEHKTGGNSNGLESMPPQQSWEATYYTCFPSGSPAVPKIKAPTDFSTIDIMWTTSHDCCTKDLCNSKDKKVIKPSCDTERKQMEFRGGEGPEGGPDVTPGPKGNETGTTKTPGSTKKPGSNANNLKLSYTYVLILLSGAMVVSYGLQALNKYL